MTDDKLDGLINIAVCGDFKQLQLVPDLGKHVNLGRVYYAARLGTNAAALGLKPEQAFNVFLKEYLVQFHARYMRHAMLPLMYPIFDGLWRQAVLWAWRRCDVLYAVLQGKARPILQRARAEGSAVLGHPIKSHPAFFRAQLRLELEQLALPERPFLYGNDAQVMDEIALCDRLFCLSNLARQTFIAQGFAAENVDVVEMPTDLASFVPGEPRAKDAPFRVACVAEITPVKGHRYLLEAWRRLALPNAELVLAGTMRWEMRELLRKYEGEFRYVGPLNRAALIRLYQDSSLLVLPSVEDGFGLVVSEALACGLPVVVTEHVGAKDLVARGKNGLVVPPRDIDALVDAIGRVHASRELHAHLREGAIASRARFPTLGETAEQIAEICRKTGAMARPR